MSKSSPPRARITVVETLSYQPLERAPECLGPPSFTRLLYNDEQVWRRTYVCGTDWEPLSLGWLEGCSIAQLVVHNEEGRFTQVMPTVEERARVDALVIELAVAGAPFAKIRPLQSCRFEPAGTVLVRGGAKMTVTAVRGD